MSIKNSEVKQEELTPLSVKVASFFYQTLTLSIRLITISSRAKIGERQTESLLPWESLLRLSLCVERDRERRLVVKGWERGLVVSWVWASFGVLRRPNREIDRMVDGGSASWWADELNGGGRS